MRYHINAGQQFVKSPTRLQKLEEDLNQSKHERAKFLENTKRDIDDMKKKMQIQFGKTKTE